MTKLMNKKQEIKNRIDLINKGEVPEGYKKLFGYIVPSDWDIVPIKKVVTQVHRSVDKPHESYYRLSVKSHAKGTFHSFVEDPEAIAMEELYKVKENDLVVNITFAWEHAIAIVKKEDDGLLVSHRFPTYEFNGNGCVKFYENIIKFPRIKKMLSDMSPGGAGRNRVLNQTDFYNKLYVPYTNKKEQEKIAEILSCCDKVIELKEKLLDEKRKEKKYLMQILLKESPSSNSCKLGDICDITTGKLDANAQVADGKYRFYTCAAEYYYIDKYAFDTEALLISGNGANVGYIHYYKGKFNAYQRTYVIDNFKCNIHYIKYRLDYILNQIISREKNAGNTPYIVLSTLQNVNIYLPKNISEQTRIVNILLKADKEIDLLEQELEQYKQLKKSLSQLLLTGIVRTI